MSRRPSSVDTAEPEPSSDQPRSPRQSQSKVHRTVQGMSRRPSSVDTAEPEPSSDQPRSPRQSQSKVHRTVRGMSRRPSSVDTAEPETSRDLPRSARRSQSKEAHKTAAEVLAAAAAESVKYAAAQPTRSRSRPSSAQRSRSASRLPPTQPSQEKPRHVDEPLASLMQKLHEQDSFIYDDEGPSLIKEPDGPSFFGVDSDDEGALGPRPCRDGPSNWAQETLQRFGELQRSHGRQKSA